MRTILLLSLLSLLATGCMGRTTTIPNRMKPHVVTRDGALWIMLTRADGDSVEQRVEIRQGDIVVSAELWAAYQQ